ncbi:hypothetical protein CRUP_015316 [Coryphaenoides rupestris]|nr:hypothetical protein CRUP_015316 [Coryphaenoides rupestris]
MEMPTEWKESSNGQLIFINRKDSNRLLEVYVKRSLSLTEGYLSPESPGGPEQRKSKWVNVRPRRLRRHSSDSILHSPSGKDAVEDLVLEGGLTPPPPTPTGPPADLFPLQPSGMFRMHDEEAAKEKVKEKEVKPEVSVSKKRRKPSLWKSFLGLFSKKWEEEEEEEEKEVEEIPRGVAVGEGFPSREELSGISAACLPLAPGTGQQKKSRRKRGSKKYRSFRKSFRKTSRKDITCVEPIVNVQPTDSYFEKVSEEMELIVHQVKDKDGEKVLTDGVLLVAPRSAQFSVTWKCRPSGRVSNGQLIFINRKDSNRLLEVYVKRSLSLTEGYLSPESPGGPEQRKSNGGKDAVEDLILEGGLTPPLLLLLVLLLIFFRSNPSGMFRMHDEERRKEKWEEEEEEEEKEVEEIPPGVAVGEGFRPGGAVGHLGRLPPAGARHGPAEEVQEEEGLHRKYRSFRKSFRKTSRKDITCRRT